MHFQINGFHGVLQTSGFLAPGKKFGQLEVYNEENYLGPWDIASNSETEWSYHWVMWHDVDNDGLLDCMAARYLIEIHIETDSYKTGLYKNLTNNKESTSFEQSLLNFVKMAS